MGGVGAGPPPLGARALFLRLLLASFPCASFSPGRQSPLFLRPPAHLPLVSLCPLGALRVVGSGGFFRVLRSPDCRPRSSHALPVSSLSSPAHHRLACSASRPALARPFACPSLPGILAERAVTRAVTRAQSRSSQGFQGWPACGVGGWVSLAACVAFAGAHQGPGSGREPPIPGCLLGGVTPVSKNKNKNKKVYTFILIF